MKKNAGSIDLTVVTSIAMATLVQATFYVEWYWALKGIWSSFSSCFSSLIKKGKCNWCMVLAYLAFLIQAYIAFLTCQVSISVVLSEAALKDKIFDALALQFILELDNQFFKIIKGFHLEMDKEKKYPMETLNSERWATGMLTVYSFQQCVRVLFSIRTGWLPATLTCCQLIARFPYFLMNGSGPGAESLRKTALFCEQNNAADQSYQYQLRVSSESYPT